MWTFVEDCQCSGLVEVCLAAARLLLFFVPVTGKITILWRPEGWLEGLPRRVASWIVESMVLRRKRLNTVRVAPILTRCSDGDASGKTVAVFPGRLRVVCGRG